MHITNEWEKWHKEMGNGTILCDMLRWEYVKIKHWFEDRQRGTEENINAPESDNGMGYTYTKMNKLTHFHCLRTFDAVASIRDVCVAHWMCVSVGVPPAILPFPQHSAHWKKKYEEKIFSVASKSLTKSTEDKPEIATGKWNEWIRERCVYVPEIAEP